MFRENDWREKGNPTFFFFNFHIEVSPVQRNRGKKRTFLICEVVVLQKCGFHISHWMRKCLGLLECTRKIVNKLPVVASLQGYGVFLETPFAHPLVM